MTDSASRLERAMEVWLAHHASGKSFLELRAEHPDLADLLDVLLADGVEESVDSSDPIESSTVSLTNFGMFTIRAELGRGGMGVVYEAEQRALGRSVALKILDNEVVATPHALTRFRREATTLARLDHPGIVRVLDVGETAGRHWLAMELIDGESLESSLRRLREQGGHQGSSLRRVVKCIAAVAEALAYAHAAGIVHRDVKPSNVLLRQDGRAVLGDFGLARDDSAPSVTITGAIAGTPHYLAPEQVRGRTPGTASSDVFSLGASLYECITLRRPFEGDTISDILAAIVARDPVDPRRRIPGLPRDLAAITMTALEKDERRRYRSAQALAEDLRAFLELRPVSARTLGPITRLVRALRRQPTRAAVVLAGTLAVALLMVLVLRLPQIRAGARFEEETLYQQHLTRGAMARVASQSSVAMAELRLAAALRPARLEPVFLLCTELQRAEGGNAGITEFERLSMALAISPDIDWVRLLLLRRAKLVDRYEALRVTLGSPTTSIAFWVEAVLELDSPIVSPAVAAASFESIRRAVNLSPAPNYLLWSQWAALAHAGASADIKREVAETVLGLWPDDPAMLHHAAALVAKTDAPRAVALQRRVVELGFDDPNARRNLAAYSYMAGDEDEALRLIREAIALAPTNSEFRSLYGRMLSESGDVINAAQEWLAVVPDSSDAYRDLGLARVARGEFELAVDAFRRVVAKRPDDLEDHANLALALAEAGDLAAAVVEYRAILVREPRHSQSHQGLCDELERLGNIDEACEELERWTALFPDDERAQLRLARNRVQYAVGEPSRIVAAAERAVYVTRGRDASALRVLAQAWRAAGSPANTQHFLEQASRVEAAAREANDTKGR